MAFTSNETTGFTITFRSLVLRAFKPARQSLTEAARIVKVSMPMELAQGALADRIRAAFTELPPNETETKVIAALMQNPARTSAELSRFCGWAQPIWHTHFGLMCQRRASFLGTVDPTEEPDAGFLTAILADYRPTLRTFTLKPEALLALRGLDIDWSCAKPSGSRSR